MRNSGGGPAAAVYPAIANRPTWQPAAWEWSQPGNACALNCRDVPDVSANAGDGETFFVGGTWGAFEERASHRRSWPALSLTYRRLFDGPERESLRRLCTASRDGRLRDRTLRRDEWRQRLHPYVHPARIPASPGYDPATGLGTPVAGGWSCAEVARCLPLKPNRAPRSPSAGSALKGAAVTVRGAHRTDAERHATSATVVVPSGAGTVVGKRLQPRGGGHFEGGFTSPSCARPRLRPSSASGYDLVGQDGGVFVFPTNQSRGLLRVASWARRPCQRRRRAWCPPPTTRATSSWARTAGCSPSATPRSWDRCPGLGVAVHDIKGIVPTRDNRGYFLVGQDGGVFAFGDAPFLGSLPVRASDSPTSIGIAATPSDQGYWVVAGDGTVYAFGNAAPFRLGHGHALAGVGDRVDPRRRRLLDRHPERGRLQIRRRRLFVSRPAIGVTPASPVIGLVPTADDQGYWLIGVGRRGLRLRRRALRRFSPRLGIHITDIVGAVPTKSN